MHYIDHIVIGIHDLEKGIASIEDLTGVKPVYGGAHPSLGTHNALISLGNRTYLEILAPNPDVSMNWLSWLTDFRAMYLRKMQQIKMQMMQVYQGLLLVVLLH